MALKKMKELEQFIKKHHIIRISSFVDSLLFSHQKKGEASFVVRKKNIFLGDSFYSTPDLTLKFNLLVPTPLRPQLNGQLFLEDKIQYKSQSLIDTQTEHFESNHLHKLQPDLRLHQCQTVKKKNNLQQDRSSLTHQSSLKPVWI
jgi:hypothetical protein